MGMSRGRQPGARGKWTTWVYIVAVRKFNYGDSIPLEAERAVKTSWAAYTHTHTYTRYIGADSGMRAATNGHRLLLSAPSADGMQISSFRNAAVRMHFPARSRYCSQHESLHRFQLTISSIQAILHARRVARTLLCLKNSHSAARFDRLSFSFFFLSFFLSLGLGSEGETSRQGKTFDRWIFATYRVRLYLSLLGWAVEFLRTTSTINRETRGRDSNSHRGKYEFLIVAAISDFVAFSVELRRRTWRRPSGVCLTHNQTQRKSPSACSVALVLRLWLVAGRGEGKHARSSRGERGKNPRRKTRTINYTR